MRLTNWLQTNTVRQFLYTLLHIHHLYSTSITDILYHLISDSGEQRSDMIKWYEDIHLIDGLVQEFLITDLKTVQTNISNLLCEFLRLAFDQQIGTDCDFAGPTLSATIERLLYNRSENNEGLIFVFARICAGHAIRDDRQ